MRRLSPWWLQAFLLIGAAEATAIGASGWLAPTGSLFPKLLPIAVTPLNGRLIGAFYLAGAVGLVASFLSWDPGDARIFVFGFGFIAGSLLIATLAYWDEFTVDRTPVGWLASYIVDPIVAVIAIAALGLVRPTDPERHRLTAPFLVIAAILGATGFVLLLAPGFAADNWPWKLTEILSRVYSCLFLGFALGAGLAASEAQARAVRPIALALLTLMVLTLVGTARHLDRFKHGMYKVSWFGIVGVLGIVSAGIVIDLYRTALARERAPTTV
jgi:hypothetical protein